MALQIVNLLNLSKSIVKMAKRRASFAVISLHLFKNSTRLGKPVNASKRAIQAMRSLIAFCSLMSRVILAKTQQGVLAHRG